MDTSDTSGAAVTLIGLLGTTGLCAEGQLARAIALPTTRLVLNCGSVGLVFSCTRGSASVQMANKVDPQPSKYIPHCVQVCQGHFKCYNDLGGGDTAEGREGFSRGRAHSHGLLTPGGEGVTFHPLKKITTHNNSHHSQHPLTQVF